jgi:hypothetical protein
MPSFDFIIKEVCTPVSENQVWEAFSVLALEDKPLISDNLDCGNRILVCHNLPKSNMLCDRPSSQTGFFLFNDKIY